MLFYYVERFVCVGTCQNLTHRNSYHLPFQTLLLQEDEEEEEEADDAGSDGAEEESKGSESEEDAADPATDGDEMGPDFKKKWKKAMFK